MRRVTPTRPDRQQAILLAAEKLFAQRGYHAVTIRQIAEEAAVPLALVGYYFGQKHELFAAIFQHWSPTIEERLDGLRTAIAAGGDGLLRRIVEAFVLPVLRLRASAEGEFYALLVARELAYASPEADEVLRRWFDPLAEAFIDALQGRFPERSRAEVACAYQFALGALMHHLITGAPSPVQVDVKGGDTLEIGFEKTGDTTFTKVTLTGPADFVFEGEIEI